jgi:hypothetical protein
MMDAIRSMCRHFKCLCLRPLWLWCKVGLIA